MMTDQSIFEQPGGTPEGLPAPPFEAPPKGPEKRAVSAAERLLLPLALVVAVLYDRLLFAPLFGGSSFDDTMKLSGIFWLCFLVLFYAFYWKKLARNRVSWVVAACGAALCAWKLFFAGNNEFAILTYLVIPCVLMGLAQYSAGGYGLKDAGKVALAWLLGFLVRPFSGLPAFFAAAGSLLSGTGKSTGKKVALGLVITLPLLCVIVPLLSGADRVFRYYLERIAGGWNLGSFAGHLVVIVFAFAFLYSFLWNVGFGVKEKSEGKINGKIDPLVCCVVLGAVMLLYLLFCAVQFTYLFAGAGLPDGMTYSDYAREGFAQTVAVCAINLVLFGIFLQFGAGRRAVTGFLFGLLGLTGVMLASGFVRLKLYIDAYGLTWLRVLSAWFVLYLAVVLALCAVRMLLKKLPVIALCALILLGWYVVLGYADPDSLIERYNRQYHYDVVETRDV